jgi:hypothetical protein
MKTEERKLWRHFSRLHYKSDPHSLTEREGAHVAKLVSNHLDAKYGRPLSPQQRQARKRNCEIIADLARKANLKGK